MQYTMTSSLLVYPPFADKGNTVHTSYNKGIKMNFVRTLPFQIDTAVKQSRYTPWRRLGEEEV
jgi:hypothetical protein